MIGFRHRCVLAIIVLGLTACELVPRSAAEQGESASKSADHNLPESTAAPGAPLPGLTSAALQDFNEGRALFHRAFTPEDGLGPLFNQNRCSSCHDLPTIGGHGAESVRKATRYEAGRCELFADSGGTMIQMQVTPALRASGIASEAIPRGATGLASIVPTSLYGLGLIEAIDSAAIARNADPDDKNRDGVSGRIGVTSSGRLARFGRKANFADIRAFVEDALAQEMGLTTRTHPQEQKPGGKPLPAGVDPKPDPEIDERTIVLLTNYVRMLAPPSRDSATAARGEHIFEQIGCTACHTPSFTVDTDRASRDENEPGSNTHSALGMGKRRVQLYSDLLLHDLGEEMATVCKMNATPSEWRTTPLMGLRFRHALMHDGRSQTLESAIESHGGEAARSRDRFRRLSAEDREALLRFLRTL